MPIYKYTASNIRGKNEYGMIEASNEENLNEKLKVGGLFLLSYKEYIEKKKRRRFKPMEIADFCRQIGSLLGAGVNIVRSLQILSQRDLKPHIRETYDAINMLLRQGEPLSDAMEKQGKVFPELLINMIRASEASGTLDRTALSMAEHYEKEQKLTTKIKGATTYPIILLILTFLCGFFIFVFVLPQFSSMFEGMPLPLPTRILFGLSNFLKNSGIEIAIVIMVIILVIAIAWRFQSTQIWFDKCKFGIAKIGPLLKIIYTARFARTLSSLYASGIPMVKCLTIAKGTIGNKYIASQFDNAIEKIKNGEPLSRALDAIDGFDSKLASTILVGEETGRMEDMLRSTADSMEYESESAIQRLTTFIEPALVIFLALIILFVVLAVMMPMASIYNNIETTAM